MLSDEDKFPYPRYTVELHVIDNATDRKYTGRYPSRSEEFSFVLEYLVENMKVLMREENADIT